MLATNNSSETHVITPTLMSSRSSTQLGWAIWTWDAQYEPGRYRWAKREPEATIVSARGPEVGIGAPDLPRVESMESRWLLTMKQLHHFQHRSRALPEDNTMETDHVMVRMIAIDGRERQEGI